MVDTTANAGESDASGSYGEMSSSVECASAPLGGSYLAQVDDSAAYTVTLTSRQSVCADEPTLPGWDVRITFAGGPPEPGDYHSLHEDGPEILVGWIEAQDDGLAVGHGSVSVCAIDDDGTFHGAISLRFSSPFDQMFLYGTFSTTACETG